MAKLFILSLGGSLIVPDEIDVAFLKNFKSLVQRQVKAGNKFILITGGGATCRKYQRGLVKLGNNSGPDLDWMGIFSTWTNAQFIRLMFGNLAHPKIITDPNRRVKFKEKILVAGGWQPGRSTDDDAVRLAKQYGARTVINLSNIDFLYDKDPKKFRSAKKIQTANWNEFKKIVGSKRIPGGNYPFDPVAIKLAQEAKLQLIIANGKNLKNLEAILQNRTFKGTKIT